MHGGVLTKTISREKLGCVEVQPLLMSLGKPLGMSTAPGAASQWSQMRGGYKIPLYKRPLSYR